MQCTYHMRSGGAEGGNGDAVAQAKERGWGASKAMYHSLHRDVLVKAACRICNNDTEISESGISDASISKCFKQHQKATKCFIPIAGLRNRLGLCRARMLEKPASCTTTLRYVWYAGSRPLSLFFGLQWRRRLRIKQQCEASQKKRKVGGFDV